MPKLYDFPTEFRIVDVEGVVLDAAGDFIVVEEPKDYSALRMKLERLKGSADEPRHGFNFEYGDPETPLVFIKAAGYQLIYDIFTLRGEASNILFQFGTVNPVFDVKFQAKLDFETYERSWTNGEPRIKINVVAESVVYKLNSRQETKVNLLTNRDFDKVALTPLVMQEHFWHGKVIKKGSRFDGGQETDVRYNPATREYRDNEVFFVTMPTEQTFNEIDAFAYNLDDLFPDEGDMDGFFHFNAPDDGKYRILYKGAPSLAVDFYNNNSNGTDVVLELCYKIGESGTIVVLQSERGTVGDGNVFYVANGSLVSNGRVNSEIYEVDFEVNLVKDANFYFFYRYRNDPESSDIGDNPRRREIAFIGSGSVNGEFVPYLEVIGFTQPVTTPVKVLPIFEVLNRILEVNTGLRNPLISNYYGRTDLGYAVNGCGSKRWLTNGTAIRQFDTTNREPEIDFKSTIQSLACIDDIGFGFEKQSGVIKVVMEPSDHFYNDAEIMQIDRVISYREAIADEIIFNELIIAFAKYIDEELNTLDAFNTRGEHLTPVNTKMLKLELLSEFIADAYSIEYTRRQQFENSPTESWRYDNDIFITDYVDIIGMRGGPGIDTLNYGGNSTVSNDSVITIPLIIPELEDLVSFEYTPVSSGVLTQYTVDSVVFNLVNNQTIITVNEATTQQLGNALFTFTGGFSFKRPESDQAFSTVDNLISPETTYNLRMSLKRILLKHAQWINSGLHWKQPEDIIQTTFLDHNKTLTTQLREGFACLGGDLNRILLDESADLSLSDLANFGRYFIPIRVEYEAELRFEENEYIRKALTGQSPDDNNYGYLSILNEDGGYTKVYPSLHEFMPVSAKVEGWGYQKFDGEIIPAPEPEPEPECDCPAQSDYKADSITGDKFAEDITFTFNFIGAFTFCEGYSVKVNGVESPFIDALVFGGTETNVQVTYSGDIEAEEFIITLGDGEACELVTISILQEDLTII